MKKRMNIWMKILLSIIFPVLLAWPTWEFYLKDKFYLPGPIFSTPEDTLKIILENSNIAKELSDFKIYIVKPALTIKLKENRYVGPEGFSFHREKLYLGLLKNIIELNHETIGVLICTEKKIIIIYPASGIDELRQ